MAFYTSVNYAVSAPPPFSKDIHEDLLKDLARVSTQEYASDFDLHIDMSRIMKRTNDGHCAYINLCYDCEWRVASGESNPPAGINRREAAFPSFIPTPLVLLTDSHGEQSVHIAPEAFNVTSVEFEDQLDVWQDALPEAFDGDLSSVGHMTLCRDALFEHILVVWG